MSYFHHNLLSFLISASMANSMNKLVEVATGSPLSDEAAIDIIE
jgi:hypothetical protein